MPRRAVAPPRRPGRGRARTAFEPALLHFREVLSDATDATRSGPRPLVLALAGLLGLAPAGALAEDSWDAIYIANSKVGSIHTYVAPVKDKGRELLRVRVDMKLQFTRLGSKVKIETMYGTIETLEGSVLRLDTRHAGRAAGDADLRRRDQQRDDPDARGCRGRTRRSRSPGDPRSAARTPPSRACRARR